MDKPISPAVPAGIGLFVGLVGGYLLGGSKEAKASDPSDPANTPPPGVTPPLVPEGKKIAWLYQAGTFGERAATAFQLLYPGLLTESEAAPLLDLANTLDMAPDAFAKAVNQFNLGAFVLSYDVLTSEDAAYVKIVTEALAGSGIAVLWAVRESSAKLVGESIAQIPRSAVISMPASQVQSVLLEFPQDPIGIEAMALAATLSYVAFT